MDFLIKKWSETPINRLKTNKLEREVVLTSTEQHITPMEVTNEKCSIKHIKNYNQDFIKLVKEIEKIPCPLKESKNIVIGRGDFKSPVLIIGEAPGEEENQIGIPFVGQSGKLLEKILGKVFIDINKLYITNMFFWQPENNRTPNTDELNLTLPYVEKHIQIHNPKLIITLGSTATKTLLRSNSMISSLRGQFQNIKLENGIHYDVFPTFHPAYILRNHQYSKYAEDFQQVKKFLMEKDFLEKVLL